MGTLNWAASAAVDEGGAGLAVAAIVVEALTAVLLQIRVPLRHVALRPVEVGLVAKGQRVTQGQVVVLHADQGIIRMCSRGKER